jgi:hypothetical protein
LAELADRCELGASTQSASFNTEMRPTHEADLRVPD